MTATMSTVEHVRVHRRGANPARDAKLEPAHRAADNKLYVVCNGRWWMLSNGDGGWRSINVGISHAYAAEIGLPPID